VNQSPEKPGKPRSWADAVRMDAPADGEELAGGGSPAAGCAKSTGLPPGALGAVSRDADVAAEGLAG
jgi:hypothetical protein